LNAINPLWRVPFDTTYYYVYYDDGDAADEGGKIG